MNVDVFISHSHKDKEFAERLKSALVNAPGTKINVWMDTRIPNGAAWRPEIDEALKATSLVALIISPDSMKSAYVTYEWCYAKFKLGKPLYLIYLHECASYDGLFERLKEFQLPSCLGGNPTQDQLDTTMTQIKERLAIPRHIKSTGEVLLDSSRLREERTEVARKLGEYNEPYKWESCSYLLKGINHELSTEGDGVVQKAIAEALCNVGDLRAIPALFKLCKKAESYEPARRAVQDALDQLTDEFAFAGDL